MEGTRGPRRRVSALLGVVVFMAVVIVAIVVAVIMAFFAPSASADGNRGTKVAETMFTVNVEPIKVEYKVEGYLHQMHPGDSATIEVKMTNTSLSTDWAVEVAITQNVKNVPGCVPCYTISTARSSWENGEKFWSGERVVVQAGLTRTLSVQIYALDGAGTQDIQISILRFWAPPLPTLPTESG